MEARETAVAAGQLAVESTTDAFAFATVNAQATSDIAANATRSAEAGATATAVLQNQDVDADGLTLTQELASGTDPEDPDTDEDGVLDGVELLLGTDLLNADTDGDGRLDGDDLAPLRPFISSIDPFTLAPFTTELEQVIVLDDLFIDDAARLPLYGLSISPDNSKIAAGSYAEGANAVIYLWDIDGSMLEPYNTESEATVWDTAFSASQLFAAVGSNVQVFNFAREDAGWETVPGSAFGSNLYSVDISPDGTYLLFGGQAVWDFRQIIGGEARPIERQSQNENTNVQNFVSYFSYDGRFFGRVRDDGSVFVGETFARSFARPFNQSADGAFDMGISSYGNILMVGYENGRVELYDYSERKGGPPSFTAWMLTQARPTLSSRPTAPSWPPAAQKRAPSVCGAWPMANRCWNWMPPPTASPR